MVIKAKMVIYNAQLENNELKRKTVMFIDLFTKAFIVVC